MDTFSHRKLYVLTGCSALFFFLCHNNKTNSHGKVVVASSFLTLSQVKLGITYLL